MPNVHHTPRPRREPETKTTPPSPPLPEPKTNSDWLIRILETILEYLKRK